MTPCAFPATASPRSRAACCRTCGNPFACRTPGSGRTRSWTPHSHRVACHDSRVTCPLQRRNKSAPTLRARRRCCSKKNRRQVSAPAPCAGRHASNRSCLSQRQLLYSEVADLADIEDVLRAAIDRVDRAELFQKLARAAKLANDRSIQAHLVDLARGIEIVRRIRIRHVHHLVGPRSDADRLRIAEVSDLGLEDAVVVEHLDAVVAT